MLYKSGGEMAITSCPTLIRDTISLDLKLTRFQAEFPEIAILMAIKYIIKIKKYFVLNVK
jgi:hypothetical protein